MHHSADTARCPVTTCATSRVPAPPNPTDSRLCRACRDGVAGDLAELPRLHREIEYLLTPAGNSRGERVSGSRQFGLVLNEEASAARTRMVSVLACWAGSLTGAVAAPAPEREVRALVSFLLRHLDVLAVRPGANAELVDEMSALVATARALVGHSVRRPVSLGPCPRPGCGTAVEMAVGAVRCGAGHVWAADAWLTLHRSLAGAAVASTRTRKTLPTRLAAQAAGVTEATIRKWASRGKLTRYGSHARAEYDVDELASLAAG
ncbi:hypothetical protein [Streptomyces sp. NPDC019224]|uniref:hypothetical protein n=1 Tax=Streptomyces sp. NPDC019224 TaxID=3154484 RepID=UPI0033ECCF13